MEGPTPVSALIHAATMVTAGVYLLISSPLLKQSELALAIIMVTGAVTAFFAASVGLFQNDIKKVIAYSTMSQLAREYNKFIIFRHQTIYEKVIINIIFFINLSIFSILIEIYSYTLNINMKLKIKCLNIYYSNNEKKEDRVKIISNGSKRFSKLNIIPHNSLYHKRTYSILSYSDFSCGGYRNYSILSINQDIKNNNFNECLVGLL